MQVIEEKKMPFSSMTLMKSVAVALVLLMVGPTPFGPKTSILVGGTEEEDLPITISPPPRKLVAVQGVVYCKSCEFQGVDTVLGAHPLAGAVARLRCNNSKSGVTADGTTDENGYFLIRPGNVTSYGVHKCKVFLASSPLATCNNVTDLNGGLTGGALRYHSDQQGPTPVALYSSGPFAFAPTNVTVCTDSNY